MATFKKTLTMSLINDFLDREALSAEENSTADDILNGSKGYLLKTTWNSTPCWSDVDLGRAAINNEPVYLSSTIKINDIEPNQLIHTAIPFLNAQSSITNTIENVLSNSISFAPSLKINLHQQGEDLWTATFIIDLRNVSSSVYTTFQDLYGADRIRVSFMDEILIHDNLNFGQLYQASKTFTWDRISTLTVSMVNEVIGEGSTTEIITYSIS